MMLYRSFDCVILIISCFCKPASFKINLNNEFKYTYCTVFDNIGNNIFFPPMKCEICRYVNVSMCRNINLFDLIFIIKLWDAYRNIITNVQQPHTHEYVHRSLFLENYKQQSNTAHSCYTHWDYKITKHSTQLLHTLRLKNTSIIHRHWTDGL